MTKVAAVGKRQTDVLVVGAGPAGLSAAAGCAALERDFLVVEAGKPVGERNNNEQRTLGTGVGGSGLYSDGKFSFYPSATALWQLDDRASLEMSWRWFAETVSRFNLDTPTLPDLCNLSSQRWPAGANCIARKEYPSRYVSYPVRRRMIESLEAGCGQHLLTGIELRRVDFDAAERMFRCEAKTKDGPLRIEAKALIHAGGRFGPVALAEAFSGLGLAFRRVEVGVRLEQKSEAFFLRGDPLLDPKLIWTAPDGRYGWRTFCCCRDGEVITTEVQGLLSVSGRADCPPTGLSNVGFNLRVTDWCLAQALWPSGFPAKGAAARVDQDLREYLLEPQTGPIAEALGPEASRLLAEGLERLRDAYPALRESPCLVVAPAIEGVGRYPDMSNTLQCAPYPMWVAGDATGMFRGLTAAMVSGYFAAQEASAHLEGTVMDLTKPLPVVFTAQSKQYFYCRDAVCAFTLNRGRVPLNPFRAFGYFLSDRVERNLVRQANFNLIRIADELWVFGDTIANGVLAEIKYALERKMPICFFTISADPEEIRPLSLEELDQLKSENELSAELGAGEFRAHIESVLQWLQSTNETT